MGPYRLQVRTWAAFFGTMRRDCLEMPPRQVSREGRVTSSSQGQDSACDRLRPARLPGVASYCGVWAVSRGRARDRRSWPGRGEPVPPILRRRCRGFSRNEIGILSGAAAGTGSCSPGSEPSLRGQLPVRSAGVAEEASECRSAGLVLRLTFRG